MAKNYVAQGHSFEWTNSSGSDVVGGQVVVVGDMVCVALVDIADGGVGTLAVEEVYSLPKVNGAIDQGAKLYWDADGDPQGGTAGSGALTTTSTDNVFAGVAYSAALAAATHVNCKLGV